MAQIKAVVLAAGKGTRMLSETNQMPKVLRQACGKPLLHYVLEGLSFVPVKDTILVVGYRRDMVQDAFPDYPACVQEPQLGTGHAVQCAKAQLEGFDGTVLVCYGDMPLLKREVYEALLKEHDSSNAVCTLLSGTCEEELPYGRVLCDGDGNFIKVVEDRDCTPEQKKIPDLNVGIYCFDCKELLACLDLLENKNAQSEYYLTDVPQIMLRRGGAVKVYRAALNEQIICVNTPEQLSQVEAFLKADGRG